MWRTRSAFAAAAVSVAVMVGALFAFGVVGGGSKKAAVDSGTVPPSSVAASLPVVGDECLVGTWRAQRTTTQIGITTPLVGGAGTVQTISADGGVVVNYAESAGWQGEIDGNATLITKRGEETQHVTGSLDIYNAYDGDVRQLFVTQTFTVGQPLVIQWVWEDSARPYTCNATTLTIENAGSDPDIYDRVAGQ